MTAIRTVEASAVSVPLSSPTSFSTREVTERHYLLVRVTDDEGHEGTGFCYAGNFGGQVVSEAVRRLLRPEVIGKDPTCIRAIWEEMYRATLLHGRAGSVMRALSAIDIALWDLNARSVGLPLWRYLGSAATDSVAAYASGGYYLADKTPDDLAKEMRSYVEQGFGAVKMKVGRLESKGDADRIRAVREAVGDDVHVMLDANNAWDYPDEASRALRLWERYDPYWIEEPFSPDDINSHARLADMTPIPVATGEIEAGRWRHLELLSKGAAAILQADAAVCGGITEYLRIAATAESFGVPMCPHWFHDLHVHLVAATSNGRYVEFFPNAEVLNFRLLLTSQLEPTGSGGLNLPTGPGLGFDFDRDAVSRFAVDQWA